MGRLRVIVPALFMAVVAELWKQKWRYAVTVFLAAICYWQGRHDGEFAMLRTTTAMNTKLSGLIKDTLEIQNQYDRWSEESLADQTEALAAKHDCEETLAICKMTVESDNRVLMNDIRSLNRCDKFMHVNKRKRTDTDFAENPASY